MKAKKKKTYPKALPGRSGKLTPWIKWEGKAPPEKWQDKTFAYAMSRPEIKNKIGFVKWAWDRLNKKERAAVRKNPFVSDDQTAQALKLYKQFMGRPVDKRKFVEIPKPPRVCVIMGEVAQISYKTRRDGDTEAIEYYHRFQNPRPLLVTGPRGEGLFLAGGRYKVTKRGIVG